MIAGAAELTAFEGIEPRIPADTGETASGGYLLIGAHGSQVRVSASAHLLLALAVRHESVHDIARELSACTTGPVSAEEVGRKLDLLLATLRAAELRAARRQLPFGFWLRLRLASSATVRRLARRLTWAFHAPGAAILVIGIAVAVAVFARQPATSGRSGNSLLPAYVLFFLSLLLHELGHAAACLRYGGQPSEIGFTLYLVFPALYSDVSSAWRLRRWQRVVVDVGGAYLQLALGSLYVAAYAAGGGEAFYEAFLMILVTNLFALNPVFKFDGYWVVADALGVVNLSRQPARVGRRLLAVLRQQPGEHLPWPRWIVAALGIYALLCASVWAYSLGRLGPWFATQVMGFPANISRLVRSASRHQWAEMAGTLQQMVATGGVAMLIGTGLFGLLANMAAKRQARAAAARR